MRSSCPIAELEMSDHQVREIACCVLQAAVEIGLARLDGAGLAQILTNLEKGSAYKIAANPTELERLRDQIVATKSREGDHLN